MCNAAVSTLCIGFGHVALQLVALNWCSVQPIPFLWKTIDAGTNFWICNF